MDKEDKKTVPQELISKKNALQEMAMRLKINENTLRTVLMNTCMKVKDPKSKQYRGPTEEEFISFVVVANAYKLNPLTREIYAFLDGKGGIVPIVSTDGWNRIMVDHPDYRSHRYEYSEEMTTLETGKECYKWIQCIVKKKNEEEIIIREHLDECHRKLPYTNPWDTHPKRMLRHKTKIQGAREAFGYAGIYDRDEAERIIEAGEAEEMAMIEPEAGKAEEPADKLKDMAKKAMEKEEPRVETYTDCRTGEIYSEKDLSSDQTDGKFERAELKVLQDMIGKAQLSVKFKACEMIGMKCLSPDWVPDTLDGCQALNDEINRIYKERTGKNGRKAGKR